MASKSPFYICNPATRQWAAIRKLRGYNVAALYHHSSSGEYRILCWKGCLSDAHYYVLTVGSSLEPRYIGRFEASDRPPILLHNCLHWHLNDYKTEMWSMKYQLELPVAELTSIGKSDKFTASIVSDYGDMLVVVGGDMHLFYCDSKGNLLQTFDGIVCFQGLLTALYGTTTSQQYTIL
ncbi:hypothetical protein PR202_gb24747 [Eleusine coracana subsp. coracana]|uniref:F-box protein n=1 Tax=Eleusine coracana subsp. coracana TaxID=191504 RepID=A0AAV5FMF7_ELECO|nr:hypothetical protein PR202_gb24747 [Eleusine coracana subsp. coracana]